MNARLLSGTPQLLAAAERQGYLSPQQAWKRRYLLVVAHVIAANAEQDSDAPIHAAHLAEAMQHVLHGGMKRRLAYLRAGHMQHGSTCPDYASERTEQVIAWTRAYLKESTP